MENIQIKSLLFLAIFAASFAAAFPVDPDSGTGIIYEEQQTLPQKSENQEPLIPIAAVLGCLYLFANQGAFSKKINTLNKQEIDVNIIDPDSPVEIKEKTENTSKALKKFLDMYDSAKAKLKTLEKKSIECKKGLFQARRKNKSSGRLRFAARIYDQTLYEIKKVKETIKTLESWMKDLKPLSFSESKYFKYGKKTYSFSGGRLTPITAEEACKRFRDKSEKAYDKFKSETKEIMQEFKGKISEKGWTCVETTKEKIKLRFDAFQKELKSLRQEYLDDQGGRGGIWAKYHTKLYDNHYTKYRDNSKELQKEYLNEIEDKAYHTLVPKSVRLEEKRKAILEEKRMKLEWREKKRRWSLQLRKRAKQAYENILDKFREKYDKNLVKEFKVKIDAWEEKALDDARKMKWQRTLEKAENKCSDIDKYIREGFNAFNSLTHQSAVETITLQYRKVSETPEKKSSQTPKNPVHETTPAKKTDANPGSDDIPNPTQIAEDQNPLAPIWTLNLQKNIQTPENSIQQEGFSSGTWDWLTEELDRTDARGSDLFRWIGKTSIGKGALDTLLGIRVHDNGQVTTNRLDTLLNLSIVIGPIARGINWVGKGVNFTTKGIKSIFASINSVSLSSKVTALTSLSERLVKTTDQIKSISNTLLDALKPVGTQFSAVEKLTNTTADLSKKANKLIRKSTRHHLEKINKIEELTDLLSKRYGIEKCIGLLKKNNSVTGYLSNIGKSQEITALYGGLNARYTRIGLSGLMKATIGRPFDALVDASTIAYAKIPKPIKNKIADHLAKNGLTRQTAQQISEILKGFDNSITIRSAAYGNEALEAAKQTVETIDTRYNSTKESIEKIKTNIEEQTTQEINNLLEELQSRLQKLPVIGNIM